MDIEDKTAVIGVMGSISSFSLGQWNEFWGIGAGVLTCIYVIWKMIILARGKSK